MVNVHSRFRQSELNCDIVSILKIDSGVIKVRHSFFDRAGEVRASENVFESLKDVMKFSFEITEFASLPLSVQQS